MIQVQIKATVMCWVISLALNGSLCSVFACRQPFPAGDRVTFNGKECVCQKCTQPLPANSPAPIQAVHSQCPAKPPALHSINHTPSQSQKIFSHYLALSEFLRRRVATFVKSNSCDVVKCIRSATVSSGLLPSAQTAVAAGKSSRTSSPL